MTEYAKVVVIGGGVVGCSCLYHLAQMGISDALLLERDELTSGSTWHAAGNLPTFSTSWSILKLQKYSASLYRQLAASAENPINYHLTGSVRLAHTRNRMDEFHHVQSMAKANGLDYDILSLSDLKQRYPFIETHDLLGALWDPLDGDIDPSQLTQALARAARELGARVRRPPGSPPWRKSPMASGWSPPTKARWWRRWWSMPPATAPARSWPWSGVTCPLPSCRTSTW